MILENNVKSDSFTDWEFLRRQIFKRAMSFEAGLVFDFRELLTNAVCVDIAGKLMWQKIKAYRPEVLIGPGYGAAPLLYSTAAAALKDGVELQILMVRDQRKNRNRCRWVEGARPKNGSRAVVLDDFLKKGSAIKLVDQALASDKIDVELLALAVFFDMWEPLGSRQINIARFPVIALYRRHDIGLTRDCYDAKPPEMKGAYPEFLGRLRWWKFDLHRPSPYFFRSSPVIAESACFVADNRCRLWRHDLATGDIDWRYDSLSQPAKGIVQSLRYADQSLTFGCYDGTVTRLNSFTGKIIWRLRQDSSVHATPEIDLPNQRMFINTEQWNGGRPIGHLQCLDWQTGDLQWSFRHGYWPPASPAYSSSADAVIATCNDQSVVCVDARSGRLAWRQKTTGLVRGRPAIAENKVYLATEAGWVYCLDIHDGKTIWVRQYGRGHSHSFLRVIGRELCVLEGGGFVLFFDLDDGELRWMSSLRGPGVWHSVSVGKYEIILSEGGALATLDTSRKLKVREDVYWQNCGQPPGVGQNCIAIATNTEGLKLFEINDFYLNSGRGLAGKDAR